MLLLTAVGVLQTFGFWRAIRTGWHNRREYYPARLNSWLERRQLEALLQDAEQDAPGLFAFLRQELGKYPDQRLFTVRPKGLTVFTHSAPVFEYWEEGQGGSLDRWASRYNGPLFVQIESFASLPVYKMSDTLVDYLRRSS